MTRSIKEFLLPILDPQNSWKMTLLNEWKSIMGSLYTKVRIEKIHDDTIVLGVFNSSWMQELYLLSPILLKTINQSLDEPRIKQIRFKYVSRTIIKEKKLTIKQPITYPTQLTDKDKITLAKIEDPALRDALKAFRIRCYQE